MSEHATDQVVVTPLDDDTELMTSADGARQWRTRWVCGLDRSPTLHEEFVATHVEWTEWDHPQGPLRIIHEWVMVDEARALGIVT